MNLNYELNKKKSRNSAEIAIPILLIILSLVPAVAGSVRVFELATESNIIGNNDRFFASPTPVVVHIISVIFYSLIGAFQFTPRFFRLRNFRWHRTMGRLLIPSGIAVALSGLWMAHFYPLPWFDGFALYLMRLAVGFGMLVTIGMGVLKVRQRQFKQHGAWMIRAYALAMGAGTQVFTLMPISFNPEWLTITNRAIGMGAGWAINILIAEWIIRTKLMKPIQKS